MLNTHACSTCGIDLIGPMVLVCHGEFVKITRDVVGCTRVNIPIGVNTVRVGSSVGRSFITHEGLIKPLVALEDRMILLATELAQRKLVAWLVVGVVATTITIAAWRAPTVPAGATAIASTSGSIVGRRKRLASAT